jgi:hypothetical protein
MLVPDGPGLQRPPFDEVVEGLDGPLVCVAESFGDLLRGEGGRAIVQLIEHVERLLQRTARRSIDRIHYFISILVGYNSN